MKVLKGPALLCSLTLLACLLLLSSISYRQGGDLLPWRPPRWVHVCDRDYQIDNTVEGRPASQVTGQRLGTGPVGESIIGSCDPPQGEIAVVKFGVVYRYILVGGP